MKRTNSCFCHKSFFLEIKTKKKKRFSSESKNKYFFKNIFESVRI